MLQYHLQAQGSLVEFWSYFLTGCDFLEWSKLNFIFLSFPNTLYFLHAEHPRNEVLCLTSCLSCWFRTSQGEKSIPIKSDNIHHCWTTLVKVFECHIRFNTCKNVLMLKWGKWDLKEWNNSLPLVSKGTVWIQAFWFQNPSVVKC